MTEFPTPFEEYATEVDPAWIDGQGHMNIGYYGLVFADATFAMVKALGLGPAYGDATGHGTFVVETHNLHFGELVLGDHARISSRIVGADEKRLHLAHEVFHVASGRRVAAQELMFLHVDLGTRRVVPFLPVARDAIFAARDTHARLEPLDWIGRRITGAAA